jgi:alkylation response protein AidB-like acyl-CoA dehydrogenase
MMTDTMAPTVDEYRANARAWLAEHVERRADERETGIDASRRGLHEVTQEQIDAERPKQKALYEAGFAGITWPAEFGGQGLSAAHERAFQEEAEGYQLPDFNLVGGTTFGVCAPVILAFASDDFKRRHIPRILRGDELWCQFFSEPVAGSDLAGIQTRATRDGDTWVLNGAKVWSSFAHLADWGLCLTRTDWTVPKHHGLTWFGVPVHAEGITMRVIRQINGGADFCEEFFDDVVIPDAERIGEVNQGWTVARAMLVFERGGSTSEVPDTPIDPGPLAPDLVEVARAVERTDDPLARQLVAQAHGLDYLHQVLGRRIAVTMSQSGGDAGVAAYSKLAQGTFEAERAVLAMRLARGGAIVWGDKYGPGASTALAFLNGRLNAIAGGTDQMQRNAISEQVLGLPREPSFERGKPFDQVLRDAAKWDGAV